MAGLPGTGLGGVFYVLLIFWMIICKSIRPRLYAKWRQLVPLGSMAIAIVLVLWGETWAVGKLVGRAPRFADIVSSGTPSATLAVALGLMPLFSLAVLLMAVQMARLFLPRDRTRSVIAGNAGNWGMQVDPNGQHRVLGSWSTEEDAGSHLKKLEAKA